MFRNALFIGLLVVLALAACDSGRSAAPRSAAVTVGVDIGAAARAQELAPQGAPVDPVSGATGVTEAELKVYRGMDRVYFDADGNEVPDESGSVPVVLTAAAAQVTLHLLFGTYAFEVEARDAEGNVLAKGSLADVNVDGPLDILVPLVSEIGSASLAGPVAVLPNQVFDVFLAVHPPGRADLIVPTTDFDASYQVTGGSDGGHSDLGIRVVAECADVVVDASVFAPGGVDVLADAQLVVGIDYHCPPVTVGVDLVPPYVDVLAPTPPVTLPVGSVLELSGVVKDAQSGVQRVEVYEGVVLLGEAVVTPDSDDDLYDEWSFAGTTLDVARTYELTIVATDGAGNQSQATLEVDVE